MDRVRVARTASTEPDTVLKHWLSFRKRMVGEYAVPVPQEIHTTDGREVVTRSLER
jgi:hypothetical protein